MEETDKIELVSKYALSHRGIVTQNNLDYRLLSKKNIKEIEGDKRAYIKEELELCYSKANGVRSIVCYEKYGYLHFVIIENPVRRIIRHLRFKLFHCFKGYRKAAGVRKVNSSIVPIIVWMMLVGHVYFGYAVMFRTLYFSEYLSIWFYHTIIYLKIF